MPRSNDINGYDTDTSKLTLHAEKRLDSRGLSSEALELALSFGRKIHARHALFHVIGKKEIQRFSDQIPELKELEGVQVVTSPDGVVLTAYRNRDLRSIRPTKRCQRHLH